MLKKLIFALIGLCVMSTTNAQQKPNISLTVVPYKQATENYANVMATNFNRRIAVNAVHEGFVNYGIRTIDVLQRKSTTERAMEHEASSADSNDRQLLLNSGADVYVEVDMNQQTSLEGTSSVMLSLKACDVATGSVLASKTVTTPSYRTTQFDKLCLLATKQALPEFVPMIAAAFQAQAATGASIALRISLSESSIMTMNSDVEGKGAFSSLVRRWIRSNSTTYHLQGAVSESMVFDQIQMPAKASDGGPMDAFTYMDEFVAFLKKEANLNLGETNYKIEGNTIYITLP